MGNENKSEQIHSQIILFNKHAGTDYYPGFVKQTWKSYFAEKQLELI